jgi:hypothetical protein
LGFPSVLEEYDVKEGTEIIFGVVPNSTLEKITIPDSVICIVEDIFCG